VSYDVEPWALTNKIEELYWSGKGKSWKDIGPPCENGFWIQKCLIVAYRGGWFGGFSLKLTTL
jgi:hypothetical protein